jgi:cytochrome c oxidase subunit 2
MKDLPFVPPSASSFASETDALFYVLLAFSFALGLFLTILVMGYAVKYRRGSKADRRGARRRNFWLEATWTGGSLVIAFGLFAWGAALYMERYRPPAGALHIIGIGKRWMWKFQHPGGQREINALHVPLGRPVLVELTSQDVIHSFFVPAFRVKQDAVPGMSTNAWFEATKPGTYHLFCAEFCGTAHSAMAGELVVMAPQAYAEWLDTQPETDTSAMRGAALFRALGCSGCHEGGRVRAPDLHGLFGRPVPLASQSTVPADDRYIRDSILDPKKEVVAGYEPIMPTFAGSVDQADLSDLVAFIRSLSDQGKRS